MHRFYRSRPGLHAFRMGRSITCWPAVASLHSTSSRDTLRTLRPSSTLSAQFDRRPMVSKRYGQGRLLSETPGQPGRFASGPTGSYSTDSDKTSRQIGSGLVALTLLGGIYYYYQAYYKQGQDPINATQAIPKATETMEKVVTVIEEQVGPFGVDIMQDRLAYDMSAAIKQLAHSSESKYHADIKEIDATRDRDTADIQQEFDTAVLQFLTDHAKAVTSAAGKRNPEVVEIRTHLAGAKKDANLKYLENVRSYRLNHVQDKHQARIDASKKIKAARDATKASMELALQKYKKAQRDAQRKFEADLGNATGLVDQAREDALEMATALKTKALGKALNVKEQADDAAMRLEEDAIDRVTKMLEAKIAAGERSVHSFSLAQREYLESLLSIYSDIAAQKEHLAKANMLGKADPAYVEAIRLLDNSCGAAISAAELTRDKALEGVEITKKDLIDKALTSVDAIASSKLGSIMSSIFSLRTAALEEVKRDTTAVLSKLKAEKQQVAKWYRDSLDSAIKAYKKDVADIKEAYNKAYKEASVKSGAARERALKAIQDQKDADEARAEKIMKGARDAATRSRERSDKQIAEMEAYFMELDTQ